MNLKKLSYKYIYFFSLVILFSFVFFYVKSHTVFAKVMTPTGLVEGTVRVNICGDYIAENPEECDREDFKSKTCLSYGFGLGDLQCSPSCEIDTRLCYNSSPNEMIPSEFDSIISRREYPTAIQFLTLFDSNGDGILQADEIPVAVVTWVNSWKYGVYQNKSINSCDLNRDGECNIYDFSILMYFIGENFSG